MNLRERLQLADVQQRPAVLTRLQQRFLGSFRLGHLAERIGEFPISKFLFPTRLRPMPQFLVPSTDAGTRLDLFLAREHPGLSRSRLQSLIKGGHILLDDRIAKPSEKLRTAQTVTLHESPATPTDNAPEDIALEILFEDPDLIVLNKPPGMVVHPAAGNREHTLVNALLHHCAGLSTIGGEQRPGIVHRLDKETSGCIVVAKNDDAHRALAAQFGSREVRKIYLALVRGHLRNQSGLIENNIGRHPVQRRQMTVTDAPRSRHARTAYRVTREFPEGSLVECTLHTGRTHQIRVHLKHLGHPILGDAVYGTRGGYPRQMLHAWQLGFTHPRTGQALHFEAPLPADFRNSYP